MAKQKLTPTQNHKTYDLMLNDRELFPVLALGPAGVSKTYGAIKRAISWLDEDNKKKVVMIRPNVSFADTLGYEKGSSREKLQNWIRPMEECFIEQGITRNDLESWEKNKKIEYVALEHCQGRSFHDSLIIVDECQNLTFGQIRGLHTRVGRYSKLVFAGDIAQTSPRFKKSGLGEFKAMCDELGVDIHIINFTRDDILRSEIVKKAIVAYEDWEDMKFKGQVDFK